MNVVDKINGYEIQTSLGSGAFGRTYRVTKGGKVYAMKVLKPESIRTEVDRKRFQRECRALQKITSDHVVAYHDHGTFDDDGRETYYIVMSFVEGTDFDRRLRGRSLPLAEAEIRAVLGQVLAGLVDIHEHNIVHRDLKPANIFVAKDGAVKIVDFGLVKMIDYTTLTMTGEILGTPLYMSPEEMLDREVDHRSDLFSFGVLLYQLLTGHFPFPSGNIMQLMRAVTQDPPERPTRHNPDLSNRLENLVLRLLEKEPFLRPSSAAEVAELLERTPFYRADEAPAPAAEAWSFDRRMCFIRLLHNEKSVMQRFLKVGFVLKEDIIKVQHNCKFTERWRPKARRDRFYLIMHEHLFGRDLDGQSEGEEERAGNEPHGTTPFSAELRAGEPDREARSHLAEARGDVHEIWRAGTCC